MMNLCYIYYRLLNYCYTMLKVDIIYQFTGVLKEKAVFSSPLHLPLPLNPQSSSQFRVIDNNSYQNLRINFSMLIMQNKKQTNPPYLLHMYLHNSFHHRKQ